MFFYLLTQRYNYCLNVYYFKEYVQVIKIVVYCESEIKKILFERIQIQMLYKETINNLKKS